jgi:hypothetical protein
MGPEMHPKRRKRQWEFGQANERSYPISPAQASHFFHHRVQRADSITILVTSRVRKYSHADSEDVRGKGVQQRRKKKTKLVSGMKRAASSRILPEISSKKSFHITRKVI